MPVNYSVHLAANPLHPDAPKKAYARAQINREIPLKGLCDLIASQTTVSRADVYAVLISASENMVRELRDGNQVDLGELGAFRLQLKSAGAESAELFTSAHILGVSIQFVPGPDLKSVFAGLDFMPVPTRAAAQAVLKAQRAGKTQVDITPPTSAGGGSLPGGGGVLPEPEPGTGGGGSPETGGGGSGDPGSDPLV